VAAVDADALITPRRSSSSIAESSSAGASPETRRRISGRRAPPERRGPRHEIARVVVETREPIRNQSVDRIRQGLPPLRERAGDLNGDQRVALALREHAFGVHRAIDWRRRVRRWRLR
jgi:hypothetical protein